MKTQLPHAIGKLRAGSFPPLVFSIIVAMASAVDGANFTVSTTNDAGEGSFRQAILDANASEGADLITFDLAGDGPHTFFPIPSLPALTDSVLVDGYSQRFASPNTLTNGNNASLQLRLLIAGAGIRIATDTRIGSPPCRSLDQGNRYSRRPPPTPTKTLPNSLRASSFRSLI